MTDGQDLPRGGCCVGATLFDRDLDVVTMNMT